jgi:uncharacterized protein YqeY
MSLKQQLDQDLKTAMLSGDKVLVTTLRGLKSAILNVEIAENKRDTGLSDEEVVSVLQKEAKKRQESAELYDQGGNTERADAEREEKRVIEQYLPAQLSDDALQALVDQAIAELGASGPQAMGQVIGKVKQLSQGQADGARIAAAVKEKLA